MPRARRPTALDLWPEATDADINGIDDAFASGREAILGDQAHHVSSSSCAGTQPDVPRIDAVPPSDHGRIAGDSPVPDKDKMFVTPLVAHLASDYFRDLTIIGKNPERFRKLDNANRTSALLRDEGYIQFIQDLLDRYHQPPARMSFPNRRWAGRHIMCNEAHIGDDVYKV